MSTPGSPDPHREPPPSALPAARGTVGSDADAIPRLADGPRIEVRESPRPSPSLVVSLVGPRAMLAYALLAVVVGRGLAPALPGAAEGIGWLIAVADRLGAWLTQWAMFAGTLMVTLMLGATLTQMRLGSVYRFLAMPAGAGVGTLVFLSSAQQLRDEELMMMALLCIGLALVSMRTAIVEPRARAAALVVGLTALAAGCYVVAELLTFTTGAAEEAQLASSRGLASLGFVLEGASFLVALAWLVGSRLPRVTSIALPLVSIAVLGGWAATRGGAGSGTWRIVATRTLAELSVHPRGFTSLAVSYGAEALALLLALAVLLAPGRVRTLQGAIGLALLSRASADVPLCALLLALSALLPPLSLVGADHGPGPEGVAPEPTRLATPSQSLRLGACVMTTLALLGLSYLRPRAVLGRSPAGEVARGSESAELRAPRVPACQARPGSVPERSAPSRTSLLRGARRQNV